MKSIILFLSFVASILSSAQDSTETERIYYLFESSLDFEVYDTFPFSRYLDSASRVPITGWLVSKSTKIIGVTHYVEGIEDGLFARYKNFSGEWHLVDAGRNNRGQLVEQLTFDRKDQGIDSSSFNYGLSKIYTRYPEFGCGNEELLSRTISFKKSDFFVLDYYYFYPAKKSVKVRYKVESIRELWNGTIEMEIYKVFPYLLNSNKNPFSHIRFDGYYCISSRLSANDSIKGITYFIKFYPDVKFKYVRKAETTEHFDDWNSVIEKSDYSLKGNTVSFQFASTEISLSNGTFYQLGLFVNMRLYEGVTRRVVFNFVQD